MLVRRLFSKEPKKKAKKEKSAIAATGAGLIAAKKYGGIPLAGVNYVNVYNEGLLHSDGKVGNNLKKLVKDSGVDFIEAKDPRGSYYANKDMVNSSPTPKVFRKIAKSRLKGSGLSEKDIEKVLSGKLDRNIIIGSSLSPSTLAHEIGHHRNHNSKAGKVLRVASRPIIKTAAPLASLAAGYHAGKIESETGEKSKSRFAGAAIGAVSSTPKLVDEAAASVRAMNILKKAGASKKQLKAARGSLGSAYGSYLLGAGATIGGNMLASEAGRMIAKRRNSKKKDDSKE